MTDLHRGTFKVTKKGQRTMVQVLIEGKPYNLAQGELSSNLTPTDGLEVEFLRVAGQPKKVRAVGKDFVAPPTGRPGPAKSSAQGGSKKAAARSSQGHVQASAQREGQVRRGADFHNPYNFIPAPPRKTDDPELGDGRPVHHDVFDPNRYSGRIRVRMVAKSPVLVPDTDPENVDEASNGHKTFSLRVDENGLPSIPASSMRGMLRSAYEAITNSRFGRFSSDHKTKIQYRESQKPFRKVDFAKSPWELLVASLRPAASISELSPADRVFGWVHADADSGSARKQGDRVAVRGCLRVGPILCESERTSAVDTFDPPGVPLAILAAPKPQQGRFYVAATPNGEAQKDQLSKVEAGYSQGKGLRGRKVYPHQQGLNAEHWNRPTEDRTQVCGANGSYQEYRRPGHLQRDDQNRSILGWVKPGAVFTFDVHVQNLSKVELGALLWLLSLREEHYFRLGGGKPLGFGSVRLTIDECDVRSGDDLRNRYMAWNSEALPADPTDAAVQAFKGALVHAYPGSGGSNDFDDIPFVTAFLVATRGFPGALPVHYPRATPGGQPGPPSPDGESFKWFVANEKKGARYALPNLSTDNGLPTLREP